MYGQGREVVTPDMTVESGPVGIQGGFFRESGFLPEGGDQPIGIVFQQNLEVKLLCVFERTLQQFHVA